MRIGVDLGGTKIEFIAIDNDGNTLMRNRIKAPQNKYSETLKAIETGILAIENSLDQIGSIGVGIPGTVSQQTGLVKGANSVWLIGHPIDKDLETILKRPVRVANDANCFALSESIDGAGTGYEVIFGVILGTGVGGGLCINGRIITGPNGIAGEWGHSPMPGVSPKLLKQRNKERSCYCGKQNCIETYLSGPGFSKSFLETAGKTLSPQEIVTKLEWGDPMANSVMQNYEQQLSRALSGVINILDPDVIILGGGISNVERLYENVPSLWQKWCFSDRVITPLKRAKHGDSSGVRGAAWLWPII
ncbi:MAG: ROK family protein [Pseudomonadota bacterium]|nr:ROK family protein [Pseudomonadota bacterium]